MRYIKLFENFDENKIKSDLEAIFVELVDYDFTVNIFTHLVNLENDIELEFKKKDGGNFKYDDIKEYVLMALDYIEILWKSIGVEYRIERRVILLGQLQFLMGRYEPRDEEDVVNIKMDIYKK